MDLVMVLERCKALAVEAGECILSVYQSNFTVDAKEDQSPLTLADRMANRIIVDGLKESFPEAAILSEEEKDSCDRLTNRFCFIVDPLDGTKEFVSKNGQFTVNIALADHGQAVMGVIYEPVMHRLFYGQLGMGAFEEHLDGSIRRPIQVSDRVDDLIVVGSRSHATAQEKTVYDRHSDKIAAIIPVGSSLKGCMIASGKADVYYRYGLTSEWDTAAMQCIVEAAGGIFLQMDGTPMRYNRTQTLNEKGFFIVNRHENRWV